MVKNGFLKTYNSAFGQRTFTFSSMICGQRVQPQQQLQRSNGIVDKRCWRLADRRELVQRALANETAINYADADSAHSLLEQAINFISGPSSRCLRSSVCSLGRCLVGLALDVIYSISSRFSHDLLPVYFTTRELFMVLPAATQALRHSLPCCCCCCCR